MNTTVTRRRFVIALAGTAGGAWLAVQAADLLAAAKHAASVTDADAQTFLVLSLADARELEAAAAQIVPSDDTPGAREARVIHFIDKALATFASDEREDFETLAAELRNRAGRRGGKSFAALGDADQIAILQDLEKANGEQFELLRSTTLAGMLSNPSYGGNFGKTGWEWIGFSDQFSWAAPFGWYDRNAG